MSGAERTVSWRFVAAFLVAHAVWAVAVNLGFRARLPFLGTLSANLLGIAILVRGLLFMVGRLRPADVGLRPRDLPAGTLYTVAVFGSIQAATLVIAALHPGANAFDHWTGYGIAAVLSLLAAQLFGNALYEEIAFRGFLLPQLFWRFRRLGAAAALLLAALLSQLLFAVAHVPNRLWVTGLAPADLPRSLLPLVVMGLFFALVYLLTDNLFAAVGVHSLINVPMLTLVADGGGDLYSLNALVTLSVSLLFAGAWWWGRKAAIGRVRQPVADPVAPTVSSLREG